MIVICTKCQAKFRVADEKIGPRGAKVRCSRCQTVFLVHPDLGTVPSLDAASSNTAPPAAPAVDLEAHTGAVRAPRSENPFIESAGAPAWNTAVPTPAPAADPFASPPPPTDPFAAAGHRPAGADPFAEAEGSRATLAVTDLSDLLGPRTSSPVKRAGPPPLPPSARAAASAPEPFAAAATRAAPSFEAPSLEQPSLDAAPSFDTAASFEPPSFDAAAPSFDTDPSFDAAPALDAASPAPDPFGRASSFGAADPFDAAPGPLPDLPPIDPAARGVSAAAPDDGGLALEDRLTPPPRKVAPREPEGAFAAASSLDGHGPSIDPFTLAASAGEPFDPGSFDLAGDPGREQLAIGGREPPAPPVAARAVDAPALRLGSPRAAARAEPQPEERIPGQRGSRLRAVAVNAVALAVLLLVALALWVVWRSDGPLEAGTLRPATILGALGRGAASEPWSAQEVRSGVYERERGAPILFVRGTVLSRATAAVSAVKVSIEVLRAGQVVARGEAIAGAVPTPEELYGAGDEAALEAARRSARGRAPARVQPGDAVPFLVTIGDAPPDLDGASLRLAVAPAGFAP